MKKIEKSITNNINKYVLLSSADSVDNPVIHLRF